MQGEETESGHSSSNSSFEDFIQNINRYIEKVPIILLLLIGASIITLGTCIHYISVQLQYTSIGFNLDDSWIHIQYARSIFEGRPWEYSPGVPSTGSTSPLWSIVLSPIFLFTSDIPSIVRGVIIISVIFYTLCSFTIGYFLYSMSNSISIALTAMIGFAFVLSNSWLMLSGMEYPIFMFLLLQPLWLLERTEYFSDLLLGIVAGLTYLARPEGVLLALIVFPYRLIQHTARRDFTKKRFLSMALMVLAAGLVVLPWVLHCLSVTGHPLPDTFYVKVGGITDSDIEAWNIYWTMFLSSMPFLTAGFILGFLSLLGKRPYIWVMGIALTLLYRFTIPYQSLVNNSRYLTPIFGMIMIAFVVGMIVAFKEIKIKTPKIKNHEVSLAICAFILFIVIVPSIPLYLDQAERYGLATKNINEMQVDIGYWIAANTPEDALLAINDVGAIRFISNRSTIDLVGLTTPDVVPIRHNLTALINYLEEKGVDYMVMFGSWVPFFTFYMGAHMTERYRVDLTDNLICGDETMIVFEISW